MEMKIPSGAGTTLMEAVIIPSLIYTLENKYTSTTDTPGAFIQDGMDKKNLPLNWKGNGGNIFEIGYQYV